MYIKILVDSKSFENDTELAWSLPQGNQPGNWHEINGGILFTNYEHISEHLKLGCKAYEIEPEALNNLLSGKYKAIRARLLREIELPMWWIYANMFLDLIKTRSFFKNDLPPKPQWIFFETASNAIEVMRSAQIISIDATTRKIKEVVDRYENQTNRKGAICEIVSAICHDHVVAKEITSDACLYAEMLLLKDVLPYSCSEYIRHRWEVCMRGYGCVGDVNGVLLVYKKP